ncbi:Aste57867_19978 [Aphanomyces stellatus]|uniref:Aste57867_19978 protein n=1 Tax=Aphanomyces stellatus TaxID=120398 RepID=A0A485LDX1_9STRA|nr:hypothetical protein As57867_019912 [Aphanomyces stellatus]VFT96675.1 Aste57867_19978 [Aphanomyces stellatus]
MYQSIDASPLQHPLATASWVSRLFFSWMSPLMALGARRQLHPSDVWPLEAPYRSHAVAAAFTPHLASHRSFLATAVHLYGSETVVIGVVKLLAMVCSLAGPLVLHQVVSIVETTTSATETDDDDAPLSVWTPIVALFGLSLAKAMLTTHATLRNELLYTQLAAALQSVLYEKAMRLHPTQSTHMWTNLFSSDVDAVLVISSTVHDMWLIPCQVVVLLLLLWRLLGLAMVCGALVVGCTLLLSQWVARKQRENWTALMAQKDSRMRVVTAVFQAIQTVKLQGWEGRYVSQLTQLRHLELALLWTQTLWGAAFNLLQYVMPVALTTASFAAHVLLFHKPLPASTVFGALALFNLVKAPLMRLPTLVADWMHAYVAYRRCLTFLALPELDLTLVHQDPESPHAIQLDRVTAGYDEATPLLKDLRWRVRRGDLVVVHGPVGCGKSSLCKLVLGELDVFHGHVAVNGNVAYVGQEPWVQHTTARANILFGLAYDHAKYSNVVDACALAPDFNTWRDGDHTLIDTSTISGGQRARLALARACYAESDIYVLDAPLAAVDALVAQHVFTRCFVGLLRHKTIILVTHNPELIASSFVDQRVHVVDGNVVIVDSDQPLEGTLLPSARQSNPTPFDTPLPRNGQAMAMASTTTETVHTVDSRPLGRVSMDIVWAYVVAMGGWPVVLAYVAIQSAWQGCQVASDLWLSAWTHSSHDSLSFFATAPWHLSIYALLAGTACAFVFVWTVAVFGTGLRASQTLFDQLATSLLHAPMTFFDATPLGRILSRFGGDINKIDGRLPFSVGYFWTSLFLLLASTLTIVIVVPLSMFALLPLACLYYLVGAAYVQPARELERLTKAAQAPVLTHIAESLDGASVVRSLHASSRFLDMHHVNIDHENALVNATELAGQWFQLRVQLASACLVFGVAASLVAFRDALSPGMLGLLFTYALQMTSLLEGMVQVWSTLETALVAPERIAEFTSLAPSEGGDLNPCCTSLDKHPCSLFPRCAIRFDRVSFRYAPATPFVLQDVSFHVQAGEKFGVVGRTGAGKSSLTLVLFRLYELDAGVITIDGVDISTLPRSALRRHLAIIPQQPVLFRGTLRQVLDPFDEYDDVAIWSVLRQVDLAAMTATLEALVEDKGANFSVGERQLLSLARALLRQAKIVVLDEATAAVDQNTDRRIQQVLRHAFKAATVVTIAHRIETLVDYDRILVLSQGKVAQCGNFAALMTQATNICRDAGFTPDKTL